LSVVALVFTFNVHSEEEIARILQQEEKLLLEQERRAQEQQRKRDQLKQNARTKRVECAFLFRREICWRQADEEREKKKEQKRLFELKQQEEDARWAAEQAADILAVEAAKWACRWPRDLNHISVADKE
jgi:hypothetical protein